MEDEVGDVVDNDGAVESDGVVVSAVVAGEDFGVVSVFCTLEIFYFNMGMRLADFGNGGCTF